MNHGTGTWWINYSSSAATVNFSLLWTLKNRSNSFFPWSSRPAHLLSGWMSYPMRFRTCLTKLRHGHFWLYSADACMLVMHLLLNIFFRRAMDGLSCSYFSGDNNISLGIITPSCSSWGWIFNAVHTNSISSFSVVVSDSIDGCGRGRVMWCV